MNKKISVLFLVSFCLLACQSNSKNQGFKKSLSGFQINPNKISVSGLSSGGYMATQFHISYSSKVFAAAILAAGPYDCAQANLLRALGPCMKGGQDLITETMNNKLLQAEAEGKIDALVNLKKDKVWVFHGSKDIVMAEAVSQALIDFYQPYVAEKSIVYIKNIPANHGMPTSTIGAACDAIQVPFLNSCDYDAAGQILNKFYGPLKPKAVAKGQLKKIDQSKYTQAHLLEDGYLYQPSQCANNRCELHIVFHGCMQSAEVIDKQFIEGAGFNQWAETNSIAVFYPQIKSSEVNPKGCWDWWGYTGENYSNQKGIQMQAIDKLIRTLSGDQK